ncbi:MAG: Protein phosphatase methylesterase 1 [Pleopsidium flavum]|nr:MAG: Protein phosphatase methylesterase 1 [Pleopsidium flavum]
MSDLQRAFAKAKLAALPPEPPMLLDTEEQEEGSDSFGEINRESHDDDSSSASSASSTGTIRPSATKHLFAKPKGSPSAKRAIESLPWSDYFTQELYLENSKPDKKIVHHVYLTTPTPKGPLFVTHHGAGSSGLSFALFASEVRKILPDAGVLSIDARGHGETTVPRSRSEQAVSDRSQETDVLDLSLETLSSDLATTVELTQAKMGWTELPALVLIGHSLGGAVVTNVARKGMFGDRVLGYAVLDVVEGTYTLQNCSAIDALQSMQTYLSTRPAGFPSLASGIEWHIRSRTIRNTISARVSVPSLLRHNPNASNPARSWIWRTDLAATQPFWEEWFVGLSKKFLEAKGGKLLLLAGTDRLDKELMIGQMQGKYQLQVFPEAGHFIQEDLPEKTAITLVDFYKRNDRSALVLPPKVGELLKKKC